MEPKNTLTQASMKSNMLGSPFHCPQNLFEHLKLRKSGWHYKGDEQVDVVETQIHKKGAGKHFKHAIRSKGWWNWNGSANVEQYGKRGLLQIMHSWYFYLFMHFIELIFYEAGSDVEFILLMSSWWLYVFYTMT